MVATAALVAMAGCNRATVGDDASERGDPDAAAMALPDPTSPSAVTDPSGTAGAAVTGPTITLAPRTATTAPPARAATTTTRAFAGSRQPPPNLYAATVTGTPAAALAEVVPQVLVANATDGSVTVIDATTLQVSATVAVAAGASRLVPSWDFAGLWALSPGDGVLTPVQVASAATPATVGARVDLAGASELFFTLDGATAVVVADAAQRIDLVDPATWQAVASVPVPHAGLGHGDLSANGRHLYVTASSGWVGKIDLVEHRVAAGLDVVGTPVDVRTSPDGTRLFVADAGRGGVAVLDAEDLHEVDFVPTGRGAHALVFSRDVTKLYVANQLEGSISVFDLAAGAVIATWRLPAGSSPGTGALSTDGGQLWLTAPYRNEVYVVDTTTGRLLRRIATGAGPDGLVYLPQPGRFSLGQGLAR